MSETGSFRSTSPKQLVDTFPDEVLDDHRHQVPLPKREPSITTPLRAPIPQVVIEHVFPDGLGPDDYAISDDESVDPHQQQHDHHGGSYDNYDPDFGPIPVVQGSGGLLAAAARRGRTDKGRSHSLSEQIRSLTNPKQLLSKEPKELIQKERDNTNNRDARDTRDKRDLRESTTAPMSRMKSNDTARRERRPLRSSISSDDSHALRTSQETEEDVCFPMFPEHVRIKGIDFDEIEDFIREERESARILRAQQQMIAERTALRILDLAPIGSSSGRMQHSLAALKYTPKRIFQKMSKFTKKKRSNSSALSSRHAPLARDSSTDSEVVTEKKSYPENPYPEKIYHEDGDETSSSSYTGIRFGGARITDSSHPSSLPDRFSFFSSESEETVHAPDLPSLVEPGQSVRELFRNGESTWWLDCVCPTDSEMKTIARAFGIHPLTAEDIRMQETREKVELFRNYYFVCFHTFEPDKESEDYLEPINVYLVVFRDGVLSFHFSPITHPALVRRRVRQLRDYVDVSADWVCYAMIDDITDGFAPVITAIEYEADAIEDSVFVARDTDFSSMLQRIGESRKKVMTLMRLLSGKADVIKMFAKRCQEEAGVEAHRIGFNEDGTGGISFGPDPSHPPQHPQHPQHAQQPPHQQQQQQQQQQPAPFLNAQFHDAGSEKHPHGFPTAGVHAQPRADIALYLGDIQDHVVTMFQNLLAYEKMFSRSHSNYLAQLQVESFNSSNRVTAMFSKVTLIGTMLVPLNLVTGVFGMNVKVPGMGGDTLQWFFGIVGFMIFVIIVSFIFAKFWIDSAIGEKKTSNDSSRRSIRSFGMRRNRDARSVLSFPNKYE